MSDTKQRYSVSFPHVGADGKPREVGDVVSLDAAEARTRLADGFIQRVEDAKAAKSDAKADK